MSEHTMHSHIPNGVSFPGCRRCRLDDASPQLLAALRNAVRSMKFYGTNNMQPAIDEASALIAKIDREEKS